MKCDELQRHSIRGVMYNGEEICGGFAYYNADEVDAAIDELKAKLEDAQASAYAESVDAGIENRRLKRALWIARAEIAHKKIDEYWPDYCHNAHSRIALLKWEEVERKCRAKAEEYK